MDLEDCLMIAKSAEYKQLTKKVNAIYARRKVGSEKRLSGHEKKSVTILYC